MDLREPATKGDLVRALACISTVTGSLGQAVIALDKNDDIQLAVALRKYIAETKDVLKLIDEIMGKVEDGDQP